MSGIASAALDAQLAELRWAQTTPGTTYLDTVAEVAFEDKAIPSTGGKKLIEAMLVLGETFGVTSEITDVLESMAPSMPNYTLHESDLPSPCGFIHLERPMVFVDKRDMPVVVKNLMWGLTEVISPDRDKRSHAVTLVLLTDPSDVRDHMHDQYVQDMFDQYPWPSAGMAMFGGIWLVGQNFDGMTDTQSSLLRFFAAFLRFIQEKWVDSREIVPERAVIKRSNRLRKIEPKIRVVRLRQAEHKVRRLPSGETIEWSHRWVVERHWRKQWYPSLQCHKPIAIESYIKGPPDKPLVVNDRIFVVDR